MTLALVGLPGLEQVHSLPDARSHLGQGHRRRPRGGQLDGERDTLQKLAEGGNFRTIQARGERRRDSSQKQLGALPDVQRRQFESPLAARAEPPPRGRQAGEAAAPRAGRARRPAAGA